MILNEFVVVNIRPKTVQKQAWIGIFQWYQQSHNITIFRSHQIGLLRHWQGRYSPSRGLCGCYSFLFTFVMVQYVKQAAHHVMPPCPPIDNVRVMMIIWRLTGNIIRTALCWIVWHNVHSQQHTYMSSSYKSNRLGLSHWDPYAVCRGGCLELYYCNMVEWFWWDSSLISTTNWFPSVLWHCWFGHDLDDQLVSFSALTLLVWSSDL